MNKERIREAFEDIKADDALKQKTLKAVMQDNTAAKKRMYRMILSAAVILIAVTAGIFSYTMPVYAISLDDTSSIELQVNIYDKVVGFSAYDAADASLSTVENQNYTDAVQQIMTAKRWQNASVVITVAGGSQQKCENMISSLQNCSMQCMQKATYVTADSGLLQASRQAGMSLGKYKAYLLLKETDPSVTIEEVQQMTMHEIHQKLRMCQGSCAG